MEIGPVEEDEFDSDDKSKNKVTVFILKNHIPIFFLSCLFILLFPLEIDM